MNNVALFTEDAAGCAAGAAFDTETSFTAEHVGKRGQEPIVRSTLRAIWLLVPDPFFQPFSNIQRLIIHTQAHASSGNSTKISPKAIRSERRLSGQRPMRLHYPVICASVSGTASLDGSNHSSLNTMRFLCFIARFAVRAMMASAMATRPLQRSVSALSLLLMQ